MSSTQILLLGGVAGSTIFLGLPVGRMQSVSPRVKSFLSAAATGILLFLIWDVLSAAVDPVETRAQERPRRTLLRSRRAARRRIRHRPPEPRGLRRLAQAAARPRAARARRCLDGRVRAGAPSRHDVPLALARRSSSRRGSACTTSRRGSRSASPQRGDELSLALVLIIGFGLHNATEGFGIVAPLAGDKDPPSWRFLGLLGLIGGGPTFVGTLVGQTWASEALSVAFLALAAGSILYVVVELIADLQAVRVEGARARRASSSGSCSASRRTSSSSPPAPSRPPRARLYAGGVRLADVYPLVTTRTARASFTYAVPEGIEKGAVVSVRLGRRTARGVVTEVGSTRPPVSSRSRSSAGSATSRELLVDLALWLADYYGSTPARALELVAPSMPKRRAERPSPVERESLGGEPEPAS